MGIKTISKEELKKLQDQGAVYSIMEEKEETVKVKVIKEKNEDNSMQRIID